MRLGRLAATYCLDLLKKTARDKFFFADEERLREASPT